MTKRDYYFDNAKFMLIFLVVFGHLIQSYINSDTFIFTAYTLIYTFHMPAFILISGYFAKGIYKKGYIGKITKKLVIPYIIFQIIYSIFYYVLFSKNGLEIDILNPHWSLWFLISLFCWNIMLIIFNKWPKKYAITLALILGLGIGYLDHLSSYLSLSRTFVFFPFFLVGYYLKKEHFHMVTSKKGKLLAGITLVIATLAIFYFPDINEKWLLGSKPYSELETIFEIGLLKRMGIYIINFIMIASFFAIVPRRKFFFTKRGENTLYVYLLHGFIIRTLRDSDFDIEAHYTILILFMLVVTFFLTILLSSKFVTTATQPLIEMKFSKWKKVFSLFRGGYRDQTKKLIEKQS